MVEFPGNILIVDDEPNIRKLLAGVLEDEGFSVLTAGDTVAAQTALERDPVHLMLLDVQLPAEDGIAFLRRLQGQPQRPPVIMMSGHGTIATAVEATRLGALDFIEKPIQAGRLLVSVANALNLNRLRRENSDLRAALDLTRELVGASAAMAQLRSQIAQAGPTEARVLITGENGTGKELIARALHASSGRRDQPLVTVNCAAIPSELLESELFGHERGAFTGAVARRLGKFERAQGGTILLDEIGDMNPTTQAKLLRVLEEGEFERVGGSSTQPVDVRVLASTNRDLKKLRAEGAFREDLYHRLLVVPIKAPALRDHSEDIAELAAHFLDHFCRRDGRGAKGLTDGAVAILARYEWPGNVRELRNLMERIVIMVPENLVSAAAVGRLLPRSEDLVSLDSATAPAPEKAGSGLADQLVQREKEIVAAAVDRAGGNLARAARELGLDRANLHRRLKRLNLRREK